MKRLIIGLFLLSGCSHLHVPVDAEKELTSSDPQMERKIASSGHIGQEIESTFLTKPTYYRNRGFNAYNVSQAKYDSTSNQLTVTRHGVFVDIPDQPNKVRILKNYVVTFICYKYGEPCSVAADELDRSQSITVYPDGNMVLQEKSGHAYVMVNIRAPGYPPLCRD